MKCRNCGHFNESDAFFCVACGEEIVKAPKKDLRRRSSEPSFKAIVSVVGLVVLLGLLIRLGTTFFTGSKHSKLSSPFAVKVDEAQVVAVAKNFKCACGGCGELPLETCSCDMPKGAVEEKNFIRKKLAEGLPIDQVIELLDETYGHRI
ncbi:MAG: hypothetical protein AB1715_08685 [Acidobacteriota bacterium]